jgi:hypothetical protein
LIININILGALMGAFVLCTKILFQRFCDTLGNPRHTFLSFRITVLCSFMLQYFGQHSASIVTASEGRFVIFRITVLFRYWGMLATVGLSGDRGFRVCTQNRLHVFQISGVFVVPICVQSKV